MSACKENGPREADTSRKVLEGGSFIAGLCGAAGRPLGVKAQQQTEPIISRLDVRPGPEA